MIDYITFIKTKGIAQLNEKIKVTDLINGFTCCILHKVIFIDFSYLKTEHNLWRHCALIGSILQTDLPPGCPHH